MPWGLKPKEGEAKDGISWGARAIYDNGASSFDILWDRQDWHGLPLGHMPPPEMVKWINEVGLPALRKLVKRERLGQDENLDLELHKDGWTMVCNPKRSFGYLYIGAWKDA